MDKSTDRSCSAVETQTVKLLCVNATGRFVHTVNLSTSAVYD